MANTFSSSFLHFKRKRSFLLLEYKSVNCKRLDDKQTELFGECDETHFAGNYRF